MKKVKKVSTFSNPKGTVICSLIGDKPVPYDKIIEEKNIFVPKIFSSTVVEEKEDPCKCCGSQRCFPEDCYVYNEYMGTLTEEHIKVHEQFERIKTLGKSTINTDGDGI